jgi:hypothetical protein
MRTIATFLVVALSGASLPLAAQDPLPTLKERETRLWELWKAHNGEAFKLTAVANYVQISGSGELTVGRDAAAADMSGSDCNVAGYQLSDWKLHRATPNTATLSYRATQDAICGGVKLPERVAVLSTWVRIDGDWRVASYQETVIPTE